MNNDIVSQPHSNISIFKIAIPIIMTIIITLVAFIWQGHVKKVDALANSSEEYNRLKQSYATKEDVHKLQIKIEKNGHILSSLENSIDMLLRIKQEELRHANSN